MASMVKRILEQESAIRLVLAADRKVAHLCPTWQDIEVLKSIDKALSPLLSLTDILSGESYVTVSAVIPMIQLLKTNILKEEETDTQLTKDMKNCVTTDLEWRYQSISAEVTEILQLATFLDPRFKSNPFDDLEIDGLKTKIIDECTTSTDTSVPVLSQPAAANSMASSSRLEVDSEPQPKKRKTLGTPFKEHNEAQVQEETTGTSSSVLSPEQHCKKELESYLGSATLDFEEDPLPWWKSAAPKFPLLSKLARKYLCVCATSCASERVFSSSGKIVTPLRASMNPHKVDMLTFLSKNL